MRLSVNSWLGWFRRLTSSNTTVLTNEPRHHFRDMSILEVLSSIAAFFALNHSLRISASSLLGRGYTSRTLKVVGKFTAFPNIRACCLGSEGNRFSTLSEIKGVICRM